MRGDVIEVRKDGRKRVRKSYSGAYKRRVVDLTWAPGVSVAQIAHRHGLNADLLFTWRRQLGREQAAGSSPMETMPALLPVTVTSAAAAPAPCTATTNDSCIEIDIGRLLHAAARACGSGNRGRGAAHAGAWPVIGIPSGTKVWLAAGVTDMRRGDKVAPPAP